MRGQARNQSTITNAFGDRRCIENCHSEEYPSLANYTNSVPSVHSMPFVTAKLANLPNCSLPATPTYE